MRIAEEGLDAEGFVKPVMLGELGSVVEADGFAHRLWKFAELTGDGPSGEDSFSIDRMLNDAEAGLSFVENKQPLAISGEQHEGFVKPVMLGELGSVVEADGFAHRLWKFAELTGDGPSGEDSFSIDRMLNDAEAGLSFSIRSIEKL